MRVFAESSFLHSCAYITRISGHHFLRLDVVTSRRQLDMMIQDKVLLSRILRKDTANSEGYWEACRREATISPSI